ncbi:MAG: hypothetical protein ACOYXU_06885 [Nitrospirota bacterium]
MEDIAIFATELGIALGLSLAVIVYLRKRLRRILTEICGSGERAEFWSGLTNVMLVITPLLIVLFSPYPGSTPPPSTLIVLKDTLFRALLGVGIALGVEGFVIWRSIPQLEARSQTGITTKEVLS